MGQGPSYEWIRGSLIKTRPRKIPSFLFPDALPGRLV